MQELSDQKKDLKSAIFDNNLAMFNSFPNMDESYLGELTFANIQLPFDELGFDSVEFKPVDIRVDIDFDFVQPLEHGHRIVVFKQFHSEFDFERSYTEMSCFDQLGRLTATDTLDRHVQQVNVVQCGPSAFVVCHESNSSSPKLSVYDSTTGLKRLRTASCKGFSSICCNSKHVFGLWESYERDSDDGEKETENCTRQRIQVHRLDKLNEAFGLLVPEEYKIERILAEEQHVVAVCRVGDVARRWYT